MELVVVMMVRKFQERKMLTHRQVLKLVMWELGFVRRHGHFHLAKYAQKYWLARSGETRSIGSGEMLTLFWELQYLQIKRNETFH